MKGLLKSDAANGMGIFSLGPWYKFLWRNRVVDVQACQSWTCLYCPYNNAHFRVEETSVNIALFVLSQIMYSDLVEFHSGLVWAMHKCCDFSADGWWHGSLLGTVSELLKLPSAGSEPYTWYAQSFYQWWTSPDFAMLQWGSIKSGLWLNVTILRYICTVSS